MLKNLRKLLQSSFVRNVIIMLTGTMAAQAITMASSPIITRLYSPEAFGIMGSFNALITIVSPLAALAYPIAIVLPKNNSDAMGLVRLSLIITVIISTISMIILMLYNKQIITLFNLSDLESYLFLIPLIIIFAGLSQTVEQWLIRTKQFSINAQTKFYQSLFTNGSKVGIGFFHPVASVLVIITAIGNGFRAIMMIILAKKSNFKIKISKKKINNLMKEYRDFPIYRAPENFLSGISFGLPVLMLTKFFGSAAAGFYSIGMTVLSLPTQLLGKSVGDVFYPRIADAKNNKENLEALIKRATLGLAAIGFIPYALIVLFGPSLFSLIFGSEWAMAGEYARWISIYSFFNFINKPSIQALPVINAQKFHLIFTILRLIIRIGALIIGYLVFKSDIASLIFYSLTGALLDFFLIFITIKMCRRYY